MTTTNRRVHRYLIVGRIQVNVAQKLPGPVWIYPKQVAWARDEYDAKLRVLQCPIDSMEQMFDKFPLRNGLAYDAIPFLDHSIFHCPHNVCDCDLRNGTHCRWCWTFHNWINAIRYGPDGKGLSSVSDNTVIRFMNEVDLTQWRPSDELIAEYGEREQPTSFR